MSRDANKNRIPAAFIWLVLILSNLLILAFHIAWGDFPVPVGQAFRTALGMGSGEYDFVVRTLRFPRALTGFLVGGCLALAGVILQGITRNPLAAPGVIGLSAGASVAAVAAMVVFPSLPLAFVPFAAFAGAFLAAVISYRLAWKRGLSPTRLLLVGAGITAAGGAIVTFLLTLNETTDMKKAMIWMTGSLYGTEWGHFWSLLLWPILFVPLAMFLARQLDVLQLGDELALGLGSRLEFVRMMLLLISVCLAAASVAAAGMIHFIGLMAPHLSRFLVGNASKRLLPTAFLLGGLMVASADLLGRFVLNPIEIPAGILISLIGAPYMVYLLFRNRHL